MTVQNPGSARQLERITTIDRLLRGNAVPTTADLARELGVSERTVYRDLVFLRDRLGAPVGYDARRRGYRYTRPHQFFPGVSLTPQEVIALLLAARLARTLLGPLFAGRVSEAVRKILGAGGVGDDGRVPRVEVGAPLRAAPVPEALAAPGPDGRAGRGGTRGTAGKG